MTKNMKMAKKTVKSATTKERAEEIPQVFKVQPEVYRKVKLLGALRRGTGKPTTGQDIYTQALKEYLERHATELQAISA